MYSDANRRVSMRRSNDEFLRRMIGESQMPRMQTQAVPMVPPSLEAMVPNVNQLPRTSCNGSARAESSGEEMGCPLYVKTPSLAMVYAPRQCWQNLLEPRAALACGTLFADLALPFEAGQNNGEKEGRLSCR